MTDVGIDTSVLIGLLDPKDIWHEGATTLKDALQERKAKIAVFDCVLAEAISTMARRVHEQRRSVDLDDLLHRVLAGYARDDILWVLPDVPALFDDIVDLVRSSQGELNFNDALIALSCRHRKITFVASFDRDFDSVAWLARLAKPSDLPE